MDPKKNETTEENRTATEAIKQLINKQKERNKLIIDKANQVIKKKN